MTKKRKRLLMLMLVAVFIVSEWGDLTADSMIKLALALVGI